MRKGPNPIEFYQSNPNLFDQIGVMALIAILIGFVLHFLMD